MTTSTDLEVDNSVLLSSCLFCDAQRPDVDDSTSKLPSQNGLGHTAFASELPCFWICERCKITEQDKAKAIENALKVPLPLPADKITMSVGTDTDGITATTGEKIVPLEKVEKKECKCQACIERRDIEYEQEREKQELKTAWVTLRHAVRNMLRNHLIDGCGHTEKGNKFDVHKLKDLVHVLCLRDPQQLYQRLESQGREYVMEIKVQLVQILVSPEKFGLPTPPLDDKRSSVQISSLQARYFVKTFLDTFHQLLTTAKHMGSFLDKLESEHLQKFGITWEMISAHLFQDIIYQDQLIQASLPKILERSGLCSFMLDASGEYPKDPIPDECIDIARQWANFIQRLDGLEQRWAHAEVCMEKYTTEQMTIYRDSLKAKQQILKEDLEFFKMQRKLLEDYVQHRKDGDGVKSQGSEGEELEMSAFVEALRTALSRGYKMSTEHTNTTVQAECTRCQKIYCSCEECTITHLISCGIVATPCSLHEGPNALHLPTTPDDSPPISDEDDDGGSDGEGGSVKRHIINAYGQWEHRGIGNGSGITLTAKHSLEIVEHKQQPCTAVCVKDQPRPTPVGQEAVFKTYMDAQTQIQIQEKNVQVACVRYKPVMAPRIRGGPVPTVRHMAIQRGGELSSVPASPSKSQSANNNQTAAHQHSHASANLTDVWNKIGNEKLQKALTALKTKADTTMRGRDVEWTVEELELMKKLRAGHTGPDVISDLNRVAKHIKDQQSVATQVEGSEHGDDDTWSEERPCTGKQDGKGFCNCCYCELFGNTTTAPLASTNPAYPQIRDRLRLKLKKKNEKTAPESNITNANVPENRGNDSLDSLLEFINGPAGGGAETAVGGSKATPAAAAKKAKNKQSQQTAKKKESNGASPARRPSGNGDGAAAVAPFPSLVTANGKTPAAAPTKIVASSTVAKKTPVVQAVSKKAATKVNQSASTVVVEDVFKPMDNIDLDASDLDEADRDVEMFKRFVMTCQPVERREKINLNIANILGSKC